MDPPFVWLVVLCRFCLVEGDVRAVVCVERVCPVLVVFLLVFFSELA